MKKNLILTGMMGVGKSSIGKNLGEILEMQFIDIDNLIEEEENLSISKIFKIKGEEYFRKIEKKITLEILKDKNLVIALGGGAFINNDIREKVLLTSISIWLHVDEKILFNRLNKSNKRPLLQQENLIKNFKNIYKKRKEIYKLAKFKIDCNNKEKKIIIKEIKNIYESQYN